MTIFLYRGRFLTGFQTVVLSAAVILTCLAFLLLRSLEIKQMTLDFRNGTLERSDAIHGEIEEQELFLLAIAGLYQASQNVERDEFRTFTLPLLSHDSVTQEFAWLPRVFGGDRAAFEARARAEGLPDFEIMEKDADGRRVRAQSRPEYEPIFFLEKSYEGMKVFGFDAASEPVRREAITSALATATMAATAPLPVSASADSNMEFMIFQPVLKPGTRNQVFGFIRSRYCFDIIIEDALDALQPKGIDLYLFDGARNQFLYFHASRFERDNLDPVSLDVRALRTGLYSEDQIKVADRTWIILQRPTASFTATHLTWDPWFASAGGMILCLLLTAYFFRKNRADQELRSSFKRLEAATDRIRISEGKYHLLFESSHDAMMIMDATSFIDCNPATLRIFGCASRDEFIGKHLSEVSPPQQPDGTDSRVASDEQIAMAIREGRNYFPWTYRRMNGEYFSADVLLSAIKLEGVPLLQATVRDISQVKKLEAQLFQAQKMEMIGILAGGIAHDFNNLLTGLTAELEEAKAECTQATGALNPHAMEMERLVERAASLVRKLLTISSRQTIRLLPVDLGEIVARKASLLAVNFGSQIVIDARPARGLKLVRADAGLIEQVITAICGNAKDAMPQGGRLTLETRNEDLSSDIKRGSLQIPAGRYVLLQISDTGMGMNAATVARIFEPFFTTKEMGQGAGLGLSSVLGIVKQHKGFITCYSELGKGTTFKIYLPACGETVSAKTIETPAGPPQGGDETILVAEDEAAVARGVKRTLERLGYTTLLAGDGQEAVDLFEREQSRIDLVLMDAVMPHMSGKEASARIAALKPDQKFLFTSGYPSDKGVVDGMFILPPDVHFIQKPYAAADLARSVRKALDSPSVADVVGSES